MQRADVGACVFLRIERGTDHRLALGKRPRIARTARRIGGADEQYQAFATGKGALHHAQMGVVEGLETANKNKVVVHGVLAVGKVRIIADAKRRAEMRIAMTAGWRGHISSRLP